MSWIRPYNLYYYQYANNYLSPSTPDHHHRSHSFGEGGNTTNVYVPRTLPDDRGRAIDRLADEMREFRLSQSRSRHRSSAEVAHRHRSSSRSLSSLRREIEKLNQAQPDTKAQEEAIIAKHEYERAKKEREDKEQVKLIEDRIRLNAIQEKEKKDKQWKDFEVEQERRRIDAAAKKKKDEEKQEADTRKTLEAAGVPFREIDRIIALSKEDKAAGSSGQLMIVRGNGYPGDMMITGMDERDLRWPRVSLYDIAPEILIKHSIPFRYLNAYSDIIILFCPLTQQYYNHLFSESAKYRRKQKRKSIEPRRDGELFIVRRRNGRSRSRSKSRRRLSFAGLGS